MAQTFNDTFQTEQSSNLIPTTVQPQNPTTWGPTTFSRTLYTVGLGLGGIIQNGTVSYNNLLILSLIYQSVTGAANLTGQQSIILENFNNSALLSGTQLSISLSSQNGSIRKTYTISSPLTSNFTINIADLAQTGTFDITNVICVNLTISNILGFSGSFGPISSVVPISPLFNDTFQSEQIVTVNSVLPAQNPPTWGPVTFNRQIATFSPGRDTLITVDNGSIVYTNLNNLSLNYLQPNVGTTADLTGQVSFTLQNFNNSNLPSGSSLKILIGSNNGSLVKTYTISTLPNNFVVPFSDLQPSGPFDITKVVAVQIQINTPSIISGSFGPITLN